MESDDEEHEERDVHQHGEQPGQRHIRAAQRSEHQCVPGLVSKPTRATPWLWRRSMIRMT